MGGVLDNLHIFEMSAKLILKYLSQVWQPFGYSVKLDSTYRLLEIIQQKPYST